ncbi:hypothetical protein HZH68_002071 [Vespula germanica]|uniref:Uncharacterized protein n=1 Tax=Vespula germanica TaxID=30212 RepID=A0A834NL72_VESGE|nr:hypothetical protein HZH68_002071 [Vespula germanica]
MVILIVIIIVIIVIIVIVIVIVIVIIITVTVIIIIINQRRLFDHAGHANIRVESPLARGSPDAATSTWWDLGRKHDRSCLEMFEADGVDSGAICKRGFIHLQFAEKPEAPEAERHLGSWILE